MENFVLILNVFLAILLVIFVLLQKSEGGALGIGVSQENFISSRSASNFLTKATAIIAVLSILAIYFLVNNFDLRVKDISSNNDVIGIILAGIAVFTLTLSVFWSFYRTCS